MPLAYILKAAHPATLLVFYCGSTVIIMLTVVCFAVFAVMAATGQPMAMNMAMNSTALPVPDSCVTDPTQSNCSTYTYPEANAVADLDSLCTAMPFMSEHQSQMWGGKGRRNGIGLEHQQESTAGSPSALTVWQSTLVAALSDTQREPATCKLDC